MRKVLVVLLVALAACGSPRKAKFLVGFSQINSTDPWRVTMNEDVARRARDFPDIEIAFIDAKGDTAQQIADLETLRRRHIDLLIIAPEDGPQITPVVKWVFDAGIPVIVIDRELDGDSYTTFVGTDNRAIGRAAGEFADSVLGGKGNILEMEGRPTSPHARERSIGFREIIAKSPGLRIVQDKVGNWSNQDAMAEMGSAMKSPTGIDLVFAHNDEMALGSFTAAKEKGREKQIRFIGVGGLSDLDGGRRAVADGKLAATFAYPTGGKAAVEIANDILHKEHVTRRVLLTADRITP